MQYSNARWPSDKYEGYLFQAIADNDKVRSVLSNTDTQHGDNLLEVTLRNVVRLSFNFEQLNKQVIEEEPALGIESIIEKVFEC